MDIIENTIKTLEIVNKHEKIMFIFNKNESDVWRMTYEDYDGGLGVVGSFHSKQAIFDNLDDILYMIHVLYDTKYGKGGYPPAIIIDENGINISLNYQGILFFRDPERTELNELSTYNIQFPFVDRETFKEQINKEVKGTEEREYVIINNNADQYIDKNGKLKDMGYDDIDDAMVFPSRYDADEFIYKQYEDEVNDFIDGAPCVMPLSVVKDVLDKINKDDYVTGPKM